MKKIFTLISMATLAMSVHAQVETLDVMSEDIQAKVQSSIANPVVLNNPLFIAVPQEEQVFPAGTFVTNNYEIVTGGTPIGLKNYSWEASTANITLKANSTLNADATDDTEAWRNQGNGAWNPETEAYGNTAMKIGDVQFTQYVQPKTGNPSPAYKDFYEYPSVKEFDDQGNEVDKLDEFGNYISDTSGEPIHRILEPVWEPGGGDLPAKGCYYEFTAQKNGELSIGIFLNKNLASNKLYIVDESTAAEGYKALTNADLTIKGFRQNNNFEIEQGGAEAYATWTLTEEFLITHDNIAAGGTNRPFYGYVTFNAQAGKTYMILTPKNQLGLFGFTFTPSGGTGIETLVAAEKADAPIYNLAGQQVSKNYRGVVIQNGKKFIQK